MFIASFVAAIAIAVQTAQPADALDAEITLERTACFGTCPVYSVRIAGDGLIEYVGKQYVRVVGPAQSRIALAALRQLLDVIQKAGYFEMDAEYRYLVGPNGTRGTVTDLPTTITSVRIGARSHRIVDYVGAPEALHDVERAIDRAAGSARWVKVDRAAVEKLVRGGSARTAEGADVNAIAGVSETVLTLTVRTGNAEKVRLLIEAGALVNVANTAGQTPLQLARDGLATPKTAPQYYETSLVSRPPQTDYARIVRLLLAAGAKDY